MSSPSWLIWPESSTAVAEPAQPKTDQKPKREPAQWRPMTDLEKRAALALGRCRLPPASSTKRLARSMSEQAEAKEPKITDKQAVFLWQFCWTFRRQIGDERVRREAADRRAKG